MQEDRQIIRSIKAGDVEAYALLVEKYHRQLLSYIFHLVLDREITEDISQEVFLSVYKSLPDFDEDRGTPFAAWLFICARNQVKSAVRKKKIHDYLTCAFIKEPEDSKPSALQMIIGREESQALRDCLHRLDEPYRSTLLGSIDGYSIQALADKDKIAPGTVKSRLFRARNRLTILLKEYFGGYENE
ncbi:RNA polymerase sigma factor [Desulforhopalus sp. 52FAK]